jgi:uncharacterized YccA/Bax inhibitor family protein
MSLFKSSNPVLSEKTFQGTIFEGIRDESQMMTVRGTMNKFGLLLLLMMGTAMYSWNSWRTRPASHAAYQCVWRFGGYPHYGI